MHLPHPPPKSATGGSQFGCSEFLVRLVALDLIEGPQNENAGVPLGLRLPADVGHLQITIAVPARLTDSLLFVSFVRGLTVENILLIARIL